MPSLRWVAVIVFALVAASAGRAAEVAPHLVGMAQSLVRQIDEADFASTGDPGLQRRVADILRQSRLRSWAGAEAKTAADLANLADTLGLDLGDAGQHAAFDGLLATRDPAAQRAALADIRKLNRKPQTLRELEQSYHAALAEQLAPLQKRAKLEAGPGESVEIEWDPETASVLARVRLGEGQGEVVLHGGAAGKLVDGKLVYDVEADAAPVSRITPEQQAQINADVFGVWRGSDGAQWLIGGGGDAPKADPARLALEQFDAARQQLGALEKAKVYIWVDEKGGEVIQQKFKRLGPPFRYDRQRSENFNKAEIDALRARIAAAEKGLQLPPVKQHDPLQLKNNQAGKSVEIEVQQTDGWQFKYDEAAFDGQRLTASRTLRDARDITDLPDWVIKGLIASWSPPEWIELEAKFNPRDKSISLEGLWWRLNVTYDPANQNIENIHTPYSRPLALQREHENILLRFVGLAGEPVQILHHDQPFRLQARYINAPEGAQQAVIKREAGDAGIDLDLAGDGSDPRLYESGILYARSAQFVGRKDPEGLFVKERFVGEDEWQAKTAEWEKVTQASQAVAADLFNGKWRVSHMHAGSGAGLNGVALVNDAGTSARLALGGGALLYQSVDMRALRGTGPDPHFLEIIFERVEAFGAEPAAAAPALLPEGEIIYLPTMSQSLDAELKGATASAGLDLKTVPEETINVLLKSRGPAHLAGGWHGILPDGGQGPGGQQSWVREVEISIVVMEDQTKRDAPTTAYYPWGRQGQGQAHSSPERTLFIFGKNLPRSRGDAMVFNSLSDGVSYHTPLLPEEMLGASIEEAWQKAAVAMKQQGVTREPGLSGLFVTARFDRTVEPGPKALTLNSAPGLWLLDFADARGRAYFVDTPPIDGAPTDIFKSSDVGFLELEIETPIPYKEPLIFKMSKDGAEAGEIPLVKLQGEGSIGREGRVYRSPPLHFFRSDLENWAPPDEPGAIKFDVAPLPGADPKTDNKFTATWTEPLRLTVPRPAEMRIIDEDDEEMSEIWRKALERAAACHGGKVKIDPRATSEENSKFLLTELGIRSAQITIGDHAAGILIRDEFVKVSRALVDSYSETAGYDSELDKFIEAGAASGGRSDTLWQVMTSEVDGVTYTAENMLDIELLANLRKSSRDYAIAFRRDRVRAMLRAYVKSVQLAGARASSAGDCKVDELMVIAGQPVPMLVAGILPRLVSRRQEEGRTFWEPDVVARAYVRSLYVKGAELRALDEYADLDDTYKALALAAAGGGVALIGRLGGYLAVAAYATVTADAIDVAYFGVKGVLNYQKSEQFYEFAKGASAVMGVDIYEEAARQSALGAAAGVLLPGAGVALGALGDIRHLARAERGAEIARSVGKVDAASLAGLSAAERLDLLAYVGDIKEAARLENLKGFDWAKAQTTSTGRRLDAADKAFLESFNTHAASMQAQISRGRGIAARLDDFGDDALEPLSQAERTDLAEHVKNIQFRRNALKNGDFGSSIKIPSAGEADLADKFEAMANAAAEAAPTPSVAKPGPVAVPPATSPGIVANLDPPPAKPDIAPPPPVRDPASPQLPRPDLPPSAPSPVKTEPLPRPDLPASAPSPVKTEPLPRPDLPPSDPGPIKTEPLPEPDLPPSDPGLIKAEPVPKPDVSPPKPAPVKPAVQDDEFDPIAALDAPIHKNLPFEESSADEFFIPLDSSSARSSTELARVIRPRVNAPNRLPQSISTDWRNLGKGEFAFVGGAVRRPADVINPVKPPFNEFDPKSAKPPSSGLFADVRQLHDANGQPIGYVGKTFGERQQWVLDRNAAVDANGMCHTPCWERQQVQTAAQAREMAEDLLDGSRHLEEAKIPQLEIVAADLSGHPPVIIQRALGQLLPKTPDGQVVEEIFASTRIVSGKLVPPFAEAFGELIGSLQRAGLFWEDMHFGNVFFQKVKRADGSTYWRGGISDTDRIDQFRTPRAGREIDLILRDFERHPALSRLHSRAPDQFLNNPEDAMIASLEHKRHIIWDKARNCFTAATVPMAVLKARIPSLRACP